jgi:hypothetical protein
MAKTDKIRTNWGRTAFSFTKQRKESAFGIPEELGIKLSRSLQKEYETAIEIFIADKNQFKDPPRLKEINHLLINLRKTSKAFSETVKSFSHPSLYRLLNLGQDWPGLRDEALNVTKQLDTAAHKAWLEIGNDKGGPSADFAFNGFVKKLIKIYEDATGQKASVTWDEYSELYSGKFYTLIETCLDTLKLDSQSKKNYKNKNNALGKRLQRILSIR